MSASHEDPSADSAYGGRKSIAPEHRRHGSDTTMFGKLGDLTPQQLANIDEIFRFLEENGLTEEGLFRVSGSSEKTRILKEQFKNSEPFDFSSFTKPDLHSAAGALKQILRELGEPVLTVRNYDLIMAAECIPDASLRAQCLKRALMLLPLQNYKLMKKLCEFLNKVTQNQEINKMTPAALGTCLGPCFWKSKTLDQGEMVVASAQCNRLIATLTEDCEFFFGDFDEETMPKVEDELPAPILSTVLAGQQLHSQESVWKPIHLKKPSSSSSSSSSSSQPLTDSPETQTKKTKRSFLPASVSESMDDPEPSRLQYATISIKLHNFSYHMPKRTVETSASKLSEVNDDKDSDVVDGNSNSSSSSNNNKPSTTIEEDGQSHGNHDGASEEEEERIYFGGDIVNGVVEIDIQDYNSPCSTVRSVDIQFALKSSNLCQPETNLIHWRRVLAGDNNNHNSEVKLNLGKNQFPFSLVLPPGLPCSMDQQFGKNTYVLTASCYPVRPFMLSSLSSSVTLKVGTSLPPDTRVSPDAVNIRDTITVNKLFSGGSIGIEFSLPRQCYGVDEAIDVYAVIDNNAKKTISEVSFAIRQKVYFQNPGSPSTYGGNSGSSNPEGYDLSLLVDEVKSAVKIAKGQRKKLDATLRIPKGHHATVRAIRYTAINAAEKRRMILEKQLEKMENSTSSTPTTTTAAAPAAAATTTTNTTTTTTTTNTLSALLLQRKVFENIFTVDSGWTEQLHTSINLSHRDLDLIVGITKVEYVVEVTVRKHSLEIPFQVLHQPCELTPQQLHFDKLLNTASTTTQVEFDQSYSQWLTQDHIEALAVHYRNQKLGSFAMEGYSPQHVLSLDPILESCSESLTSFTLRDCGHQASNIISLLTISPAARAAATAPPQASKLDASMSGPLLPSSSPRTQVSLLKLKELCLDNCAFIDDNALFAIGNSLGSTLENLSISRSEKWVTERGVLGAAFKCLRLKYFNIQYCQNPSVVRAALFLQETFPELVVLV